MLEERLADRLDGITGSAGIAELAVFHPVCWLHLSGGDNRGQAEERRGHSG